MKKIVFSVAFLGMVISASAQCGSVEPGIRALKNDKIAEAKTLFEKAGLELKASDAKNESIDAKCYAKYYYGSGATTLQQYNNELDLTSKVALLNKAEGFFTKFFELDYEDKSYRVKAITDLEAVANRQKEVGYDYFQKSDFETAFMLFEKCINNKSKLGVNHLDLNAYHNASVAASRLGDYEKAIEYNEVILKNPNLKIGEEVNKSEKFLSRKGEYLAELGKIEEAISLLDSASKAYPDNSEIEMQQLKVFMAAQDNDGAIVVLEKLTKKITNREDLFLVMGQIYREKGEAEKSYAAYQTALGINPQSETALYSMGVHYVNKSDEYVQNLNNVGSSQSDQAAKEGAVAERNKNLDKAIKYFNSCLEINPKDRSTLNALKKIYELQEKKEEVEAINQKLMAE